MGWDKLQLNVTKIRDSNGAVFYNLKPLTKKKICHYLLQGSMKANWFLFLSVIYVTVYRSYW